MSDQNLGRLVSVHGVDPAYMQRGIFVVVLSFLFFLGTMFIYNWRQSIAYFLLVTAFLIIYLVTMFSIVRLRRHVMRMYDAGFIYRGQKVFWTEIESIGQDGAVELKEGKAVILPRSLHGIENILSRIRLNATAARR